MEVTKTQLNKALELASKECGPHVDIYKAGVEGRVPNFLKKYVAAVLEEDKAIDEEYQMYQTLKQKFENTKREPQTSSMKDKSIDQQNALEELKHIFSTLKIKI